MVRNPVEMVRSLHGQYLRLGTENVEDLERAWSLQGERANGHFIPRFSGSPELLQYGRVCSTGSQLKRLFDLVPKHQRHVVVLDDLQKDPFRQWKILLSFLNIDDEERAQFGVYNSAKAVRSKKIRAALRSIERVKEAAGLPKLGLGLMRRARALNYREQPNKPISQMFRTELSQYFRDDIELLSEILERDFRGWLTREAAGRS